MGTPVRKSLQRDLIGTLAATAFFFSTVVGIGDFVRTYNLELERSYQTFANMAATVSSSAAIAAYVGNENIAQDVADGLLNSLDVLGVRIQNNRGFKHQYAKEGVDSDWGKALILVYTLHSPTNVQEDVGTLEILPDTERINQRARQTAFKQAAFLVAQTLLLLFILAIAYQRRVGRPLLRLTEQLTRIKPGSEDRIKIDSDDTDNEIGLVSRSVNHYLDISEHALRMERELRERVSRMESHYRRIFESTKVGVMVLDMNGGLINANSVVIERSGQGTAAEPTDYPLDYLNQVFKYPKKAWLMIDQTRSSGNLASGDLELADDSNDARWSHCLFSIGSFPESELNYIEVVFYDVTSRRKREEKALRSAERDSLTDLVNRQGTLSFLERSIADARVEEQSVTLLFLDLDGFKIANDTYGHAAGDTVLVEVTRRLRTIRRRSADLLGRIGGDEFVIAAYGMRKTDDAAHALAAAILQAIGTPISIGDGQEVLIGVSIGIAGFPENANSVDELMEAADQAMYEAKKRGKNGYQVAPSKA